MRKFLSACEVCYALSQLVINFRCFCPFAWPEDQAAWPANRKPCFVACFCCHAEHPPTCIFPEARAPEEIKHVITITALYVEPVTHALCLRVKHTLVLLQSSVSFAVLDFFAGNWEWPRDLVISNERSNGQNTLSISTFQKYFVNLFNNKWWKTLPLKRLTNSHSVLRAAPGTLGNSHGLFGRFESAKYQKLCVWTLCDQTTSAVFTQGWPQLYAIFWGNLQLCCGKAISRFSLQKR